LVLRFFLMDVACFVFLRLAFWGIFYLSFY
jgi:hypothetical protein